jgi:hypothetical protein
MASTPDQHRDKWLHNRRFVSTIADEYADWMVTVLFYAALHAVETLLAHDRVMAIAGHTARNQTLKTVNRYRQVWIHYRPLYDAAHTAPYDPAPASWLPVDDVKSKLVVTLYALEKSVLKLTGSASQLDPVW